MFDKSAVVLTGASAGIGLSVLEALMEDAFVVAVSRTRPPVTLVNGCWVEGDLRAPESAATEILAVLSVQERPLDGLIHCAASYGIPRRHTLLETSDNEWDDLMSINARSQFVLTVRLLPLLLRRPAAFIVSLTSDVATRPAPLRIAYGCSKSASYALFRGLAEELTGSAVSVIQMLPVGQVATRGLRQRRPPDFDFAGYSSPDIFKQPLKSILASRGAGLNGACLLIREDGSEEMLRQ